MFSEADYRDATVNEDAGHQSPVDDKAGKDGRGFIILRPSTTEEYVSDKTDILDLVRKRIEERKLTTSDIRKTIKGWRPEEHYRVTCGFYDVNISTRRIYQIARAVGLRRTKALPFSL